MSRIIPWVTAAGLLGLFVTVYVMASTGTKEIRSIPTEKFDSSVQLSADEVGVDQNYVDPLHNQLAMLDQNIGGQVVGSTKSAPMIEVKYSTNGPKHLALSVDKVAFDNSSQEIIQEVWDRWLNIDEGYLSRHTHWHKPDRADITFENFTKSLHFFPADKKFSEVTAVCNKRSNYNELLLYTDGHKWLDLNQERSNKYSVTLWEWYNTVAIKSGEQTFIEHRTPKVHRWNAPITPSLADAILKTGELKVYVEGNQSRFDGVMMNKREKKAKQAFPNLNLHTTVTIQNIDEVRGCFGTQEQFVNKPIKNVTLNTDFLGLMAYFEDKSRTVR